MGAFISGIIVWYFGILGQAGLLWVVMLMAMESSIFPVPSELVIPPAVVAYLEQNRGGSAAVQIVAVILAGTLGSFLGASATYGVSRWLGRPLILKYGKYVLISERKLQKADRWMVHYGAGGIFIARLLPVVRHVISIPAGIIGMRFRTFALMTIIGSFLWCSVLTLFGFMMRADISMMITQVRHGAALAEDRAFQHAFNNLTFGTLALVGVAMLIYWWLSHRHPTVPDAAMEKPERIPEICCVEENDPA